MKFAAALAFGVLMFPVGSSADVREIIKREAAAQGIPAELALRIAKAESGFKCGAVGRHGERGVMQIAPRTAKAIGYRGPASGLGNCATGIRYGMIYLRMAYKKAGGDWYRTAILYSAGLGSTSKKSVYAKGIQSRRHHGGHH